MDFPMREPPCDPPKYPKNKNDYRILEQISTKSTGVFVQKAQCIPLKELVAIKIIDLTIIRNHLEYKILLDETKKFPENENILKPHCYFVVEQKLWVVMPYLAAGSLQSIVSTLYPVGLPEGFIASVLKGLLTALVDVHRQGCTHLGIKTGNILLDSEGVVRLSDFGVSSWNYGDEVFVRTGEGYGMPYPKKATPYWLPPEALNLGLGLFQKADVWSVGVIALELLLGVPPVGQTYIDGVYEREGIKLGAVHRKRPIINHSKRPPFPLQNFISQCLVLDPVERPSSLDLLNDPYFAVEKCWGKEYWCSIALPDLKNIEERAADQLQGDERVFSLSPLTKGDDLPWIKFSGWKYVPEIMKLMPVFLFYENYKPQFHAGG